MKCEKLALLVLKRTTCKPKLLIISCPKVVVSVRHYLFVRGFNENILLIAETSDSI